MFTARYGLNIYNSGALGHVSLPALQFSPVSIFPPILHTHPHVALTRRTDGRSLGIFEKQCSFGNRERCTEKYFHFIGFLKGLSVVTMKIRNRKMFHVVKN